MIASDQFYPPGFCTHTLTDFAQVGFDSQGVTAFNDEKRFRVLAQGRKIRVAVIEISDKGIGEED
jgi:hypothetical protein